MKSIMNKRLPGILAAGLVALAVGAAGAPASAATAETSSGATVSGLTKKQKKAKKKALKKCNKKKPAKKKRACRKQVNKKYKRLASKNNTPQIGKTWQVSVGAGGNFFAPSLLSLKANDAINWSWANITGNEPHNVTLVSGPNGADRNAFASQLTSDPGYRFKRQFTVAGDYSFVCNIHVLMTMNVNVSK